MSYDVWLTMETGAGREVEVWSANYTSNVSGMWYKAMLKSGAHFAIWETGGWRAGDAAPLLEAAVEYMATNPTEFKDFEPENGWGSYDGALSFLRDLVENCLLHPSTTVKWSI